MSEARPLFRQKWWMTTTGFDRGRYDLYDRGDHIQADHYEHYNIERRRLYYEDIVMLSLHSRANKLPGFLSLGVGLFLGMILLLAFTENPLIGALVVIALTVAPLLLFAFWSFVVGTTTLRIHGMRSDVDLRIGLGRNRLRRLMEELSSHVRTKQAALLKADQPADPEPAQ